MSDLLMPTLLAASTPCFLHLWLTSPVVEYTFKPATGHACSLVKSHRCHRQLCPKAAASMHWLTSNLKRLPKVNVEGLPTHGLIPLHARSGNNVLGQILKFDALVEGGDSQVGKRCLRTDVMVSVPVAEEA